MIRNADNKWSWVPSLNLITVLKRELLGFCKMYVLMDFRKHNVTEQEMWLEETLATSEAEYLILVAHHPSYSAGEVFGNIVTRDYLDPILEEFDVDVFLTGHDHNLQVRTL